MLRPLLLAALTANAFAAAALADTIFFSRSFPGSVPEYFEVEIDSGGRGVYREEPDEDEPLTFEVGREDLDLLFGKAQELERFRAPIASKRKTAFTGDKILRYTGDDGANSEARYVHTEVPAANELTSWFLFASETGRHRIHLERALQFDRLGVEKLLRQIHASFDKGRVVAPAQLLPLLRQVVEDQRILHQARARAAALIEQIEAGDTSR